MKIGGREYPTPLLVGGVAGVAILVIGQRLRGDGAPAGGAEDPAGQKVGGAGAVVPLDGTDVGQFPAPGVGSSFDWWDAGETVGVPSFPQLNDPTPTIPSSPTPTPTSPTPTPTSPTPTPTSPTTTAPTYPAGTAAKAIFPAGTYKTGLVSGSTFLGYGPDMTTGGFSAWASAPKTLNNPRTGSTTNWFKLLSGSHAGKWFYRYDAHIRWQPV